MTIPIKVIVVGAGWSGLVAAKTYMRVCKLLDRPLELIVLDGYSGPGGVWSNSRLYPGLIANSPVGLYEYSHLSMVSDKRPWYQLLPGVGVQSYLEDYARKFDIYSKIRFETRVTKARRRKSETKPGWIIETDKGDVLECDKLVVACGLYNKPKLPSIPSSTYSGVSIHSHDLGKRNAALRSDPSIKNIVIVGGAKSAVEACNVFLPTMNPGKTHRVSWIIRPSASGVPMVVQDVEKNGNIVAMNTTRAFGDLSPSIYNTSGFGYKLLHSGRYFLGSLLLTWIWRLMSWALKRDAKYTSSVNGRKIEPQGLSLFYDLNNVSLIPTGSPVLKYLHQDDDNILKVHRATPIKLQNREMILLSADGSTSTVPCDAVIWCTGWLPSIDFFSPSETRDLGLPIILNEPSPTDSKDLSSNSDLLSNPKPPSTYYTSLSPSAQAADKQVLSLFPSLRDGARSAYPPTYTPFKLYRQCLPLTAFPDTASGNYDRTLAFTGLISTSQTAITSELTSLYSIAFLESLLPSPPLPLNRSQASSSIELQLSFQRHRYGLRGARDPEIVLEIQTFLDQLCGDMGVEVYRKIRKARGKGWWEEWKGRVRERLQPYVGADYEGVVEEFLGGEGVD